MRMPTGWSGWVGGLLALGLWLNPTSGLPLTLSADEPELVLDEVVLRLVEERRLYSKASGMIQHSHLREGKRVTAGEILLQLDSERTELTLQRLEAERAIILKQAGSQVELEFGEKSMAVATADLERVLSSNQRFPGLYPEAEVNRMQLLVDRAQAEYQKNQFQLEVLALQAEVKKWDLEIGRVDLSDRTMTASMDGMIVEVYKREGEWVEVSEPLAKLVRLDRLRLEVDVPIRYSTAALQSAKIRFVPESIAGGMPTAMAEVSFVHPEINPITRTSRVWLEVANPDGALRPGTSGRVEIVIEP